MARPIPKTLAALAADLGSGKTTALALAEACLARIADPEGEGRRTILQCDPKKVRAQAAAQDALRAAGAAASPLAGIPISVKDLFDVQGEVTKSGSRILDGAPPATADAIAIARLRRAGAVIVGRTTMSEFAFSGLGINPHYGTPKNPYDRKTGRIPGGSSSGAAISVTDGMAHAGIGTDTGGSCRIPAALTGVVGFKPTARRVPLTGCMPLATSLDSIGPLARSVDCCALIDALMAGEEPVALPGMPVRGLRLAVPGNVVLDHMDKDVAAAFQRALTALSKAGAAVSDVQLPVLDKVPGLFAKGGIACAEAYAFHQAWLAEHGPGYDPRIRVRIELGREQSAADYIGLLHLRAALGRELDTATAPYDAVLMPGVAIVAPPIAALDPKEPFETYMRINGLILRNTAIGNQMDRCSIAIPCHGPGEPPVGLMLVGERGADRRLLMHAKAVETALAPIRLG